MRRVHVPALKQDVSAIGMGCASLGSRVAFSAGQRAILHAIDRGVSWIDVAPPYGDGMAEEWLGRILKGRRRDVVICTKCGIARPTISLGRRLLRPAARTAIAMVPSVRGLVSRARPTGRRAPLTPAQIEASVVESLRRLGSDYVDVLALHEPDSVEACDPNLLFAMRRLVEKGMVRAISIAAGHEAIAAASGVSPFDLVQFPDSPQTGALRALRMSPWVRKPTFVTHGVYHPSAIQEVTLLMDAERDALSGVTAARGLPYPHTAFDLLARFAFDNNAEGVVVASMFSPAHIDRNVAAASVAPSPQFAEALQQLTAKGAGRAHA